jgi:CheY-like chemotaxis protein
MGAKMHILYVEDDAADLFLVERIASMGQYEVLNYRHAEEALRHFAADVPDLVLVDCCLAGEMDGLELVETLRAKEHTTPIIALTAFASEQECLQAGCDDYLAKPVAVQRLWQLLQHYAAVTKRQAQND